MCRLVRRLLLMLLGDIVLLRREPCREPMRRLVIRVDLLLRMSWYVVGTLLEDRIVIWFEAGRISGGLVCSSESGYLPAIFLL